MPVHYPGSKLVQTQIAARPSLDSDSKFRIEELFQEGPRISKIIGFGNLTERVDISGASV